MKILIVEDDNNLRSLLKKFFEKNGYIVEEADEGEKGLEEIFVNEYDCVLLDLNLPNLDGVEIARRVREKGIEVPLVMLTARSQLYNKLEGFDMGADDYITKPFDMNEVLARVKAVVRRFSKNKESRLSFNDMYLDVESNRLFNNEGFEILLSNKETGILEYMIRNKGKIISAEEFLEHVWDREANLFSDTVKTHIKTLRKKVDSKKKYIKTIRGKGYLYEIP
jgi:DNA-binding response OmpR family regulator